MFECLVPPHPCETVNRKLQGPLWIVKLLKNLNQALCTQINTSYHNATIWLIVIRGSHRVKNQRTNPFSH